MYQYPYFSGSNRRGASPPQQHLPITYTCVFYHQCLWAAIAATHKLVFFGWFACDFCDMWVRHCMCRSFHRRFLWIEESFSHVLWWVFWWFLIYFPLKATKDQPCVMVRRTCVSGPFFSYSHLESSLTSAKSLRSAVSRRINLIALLFGGRTSFQYQGNSN